MIIATEGIVIKNTKYSERSIISKIYTRQLGMQSFMIYSVKGPKASIKPSLLQYMMPLDLVIYQNKLKEIQRITEAKVLFLSQTLYTDIVKSSILMYVAELIYKTIKEQESNHELFDFLINFLKRLDQTTHSLSLFPLVFALHLSRYLGFFPDDNYSETNPFFSLAEGRFVDYQGINTLNDENSKSLFALLSNLDNLEIEVHKKVRLELLTHLLHYFKLHLPDFHSLNSINILSTVLKEE